MALTPVSVTSKFEAAQYDGTNGSDIADWLQDATFVSDDGEELVLSMVYGGEYTVPVNAFVIRQESYGLWGHYVGADYTNKWSLIPVITQAIGIANVPSLVADATTTVSVTLTASFADSSYNAQAVLVGGVGVLAALEITSVTVTDINTVDVAVHNTGLITLSGAQILVTAIKS